MLLPLLRSSPERNHARAFHLAHAGSENGIGFFRRRACELGRLVNDNQLSGQAMQELWSRPYTTDKRPGRPVFDKRLLGRIPNAPRPLVVKQFAHAELDMVKRHPRLRQARRADNRLAAGLVQRPVEGGPAYLGNKGAFASASGNGQRAVPLPELTPERASQKPLFPWKNHKRVAGIPALSCEQRVPM